jgi:hypothetical protein
MTRRRRSRRPLRSAEPESIRRIDFDDPASQRVLGAAAQAVSREWGKQAGREWFESFLAQHRKDT